MSWVKPLLRRFYEKIEKNPTKNDIQITYVSLYVFLYFLFTCCVCVRTESGIHFLLICSNNILSDCH